MKKPLVSVIITTKDSEKNLPNCLLSLQSQDYPQNRMEIIIVDNNSADKTGEIAKKFTKKVYFMLQENPDLIGDELKQKSHPPLEVARRRPSFLKRGGCHNFGPERASQRNFGIKKAKGKYLLFLDSDMSLSKRVIQNSVEKMEKKKSLIGLYIPEIIKGKSFFSQVRNFERSFYNGTVIDAVRLTRSKETRKIGGFDESLTGPEDWDFDKRLRKLGRVEIITEPLFHDETDFNLKKYLQKKLYYSRNFTKYIKKWGKNDPDIKKQFSCNYRFFGVFLENGKWKQLIKKPRLVLGMYLLRFSVGMLYLFSKMSS